MEAKILYRQIKRSGLSIKSVEGNLHVWPKGRITDSIRSSIKEIKSDLVDFVEEFEERAAILEYSAHDIYKSRQEAEQAE